MTLDRRTVLAMGASLAMPSFAQAQAAEKSSLTLGVGGKSLLYYLPLTVAERKGYFKDQGLSVEINDFGGGAKSLQALIGGSVDVVTGAYEHTIRMQAKGQDVRAIMELGRFPAIVLAVKKDLAGEIKSAADLKGRKIGVTAPGSSTSLFAQYALVKAGLKPSDAALIGVGSGAAAVAALKKGEIDAISHLDPVIAKLEADGDIVILIDTRTEAGTKALFGASNPAATVYMKNDFMTANPVTCQKLANAFMQALKWIAAASPSDIANAVPEAYHLGDRPLYEKAVAASKESYSHEGIIAQSGMDAMLAMLKLLDPELANAQVDLGKTFDARFAQAAANVKP